MLYGFLVSLFIILCLILILLVLLQKGKSSMGLGSLGGGTQMLFGGSGGQDLFQKTTWVLGAIFMGGSLGLALMKKPPKSALLQKLAQKQESTKTPENKALEAKNNAAAKENAEAVQESVKPDIKQESKETVASKVENTNKSISKS